MNIIFISSKKTQYGGKVYEEMAREVLSRHFQVESVNLSLEKKPIYFKIPLTLFNLWKISQRTDCKVVIKNFDSCLFLNKKPVKNIAVVHHIDYSFAPAWIKLTSFFSTPLILRNLRKVEAIVVVSKFWENFFKSRGYKNVFLIYNAFNLDNFHFTEKEVEEFKKQNQLVAKPIIYLGNCQKAKGVLETYNALKDLDCHLVTSGKQMVKIPAKNLEIEYRDYLKLLKASSIVITMSKFKEGWCRTAHEAMLLKRPVIGSGKGGMRELLEGGKQIICEDFKNLKEKVEYLLNHPEIRMKMGEDGFNFAQQFTLEKFKKNWLELINKIK